jgi:hypothetical protein
LDQVGMEAAGPGPGPTKFLEGGFIDADNQQVGGGGLKTTPGVKQVQPRVFQDLSGLEDG